MTQHIGTKTTKKIHPIIFLAAVVLVGRVLLFPQQTLAASMQNEQSVLELLDPQTDIPSHLELPVIEEKAPIEHPTTITSYGSITVSASGDVVSFAKLSPTNPYLRSLTITFGGNGLPISLYQRADTSLQTPSGAFIPQTTCDAGSCTSTQAALWQNTLTFGYGYTCGSIDSTCSKDFQSKNMFRQIPTEPDPARVVAEAEDDTDAVLELTYQVIVPGTQSPGSYENTISLLFAARL